MNSMRAQLITLGLFTLAVIAAPLLLVHADADFDSALFSATNGDRANVCHVSSLGWSSSMAAIAQQRAQYIADTGDTTNHLEMSYGAENTGQSYSITDASQAAAYVNQAYLNSPPHKANICDPRWNVVGIASVFVTSWQGHSNVWIDAEEFTGQSSSPQPSTPPIAPSHNDAGIPPVPGTGGAG